MLIELNSHLLEKSRQHLVKLAKQHNVPLLQTVRYAHATQYKRMKHTLKTLRTRVGWVCREVKNKQNTFPVQVQPKSQDLLHYTAILLDTRITSDLARYG